MTVEQTLSTDGKTLRGFRRQVGDRRIVIAIGRKTQTISICTSENKPGVYQERYRLTGVPQLRSEDFVGINDLVHLRAWIADEFGSAAQHAGTDTGRRPLPQLIAAPPADDLWLRESAGAVETSIDRLIEDFMAEPFLHRVEHSVHTQLVGLLVSQKRFAGTHLIGSTGRSTQLVHKEWPETIADAAANKRGSFDIAVLAPNQLTHATLDHLRTGTIAAGIVIEMGLNYRMRHLQQDYDKLVNSKVPYGYLVHLSRDTARDKAVETFLARADRHPDVKIAYAHNDETGYRAFKLVNGTDLG